MDSAPENAVAKTRPRWLRMLGMAIGLALLIAAVITIISQHDTIVTAWKSIAELPRARLVGLLALLAGTVVINIIFSGLLFSVLMSRYGRVGLMEMQAVLAATTLVNYLPLRPGLFGRVAYHKAVNGIPVSGSVKMIFEAVAWSVGISMYLLAVMFASLEFGVSVIGPAAAPLAILGAGAVICKGNVRRLLAAGLIRYIEVLVLAVRYHAGFALIGTEIDMPASLGFACANLMATMVPFVSNGLGLREWCIGLLSPVLTAHRLTLGITADLLNRAVEIIVALPIGLIGIAMLTRLRTRRAESIDQSRQGT